MCSSGRLAGLIGCNLSKLGAVAGEGALVESGGRMMGVLFATAVFALKRQMRVVAAYWANGGRGLDKLT